MIQLWNHMGNGPGKEMLDSLIKEAASTIAEIKRKVVN
jgi:hypothetical protein